MFVAAHEGNSTHWRRIHVRTAMWGNQQNSFLPELIGKYTHDYELSRDEALNLRLDRR